ncbi:hypothetical protein QQ020_33235 [Fulvivirgaceae bacterium BMA12]|uniref:Uncharacterized protein n=1 Tax=Agaribacillus aureus TaxID=3051825 RepID=A0ABT8LGT3_9BACT|nr:hypothetical protein [Fulvivirgaceae bacterium BMA12]
MRNRTRLTNKILPAMLWFLVGCPFGGKYLMAQQIQIDRGIRVNDLWCFPTLEDSLVYRYLPNDARLGLDKHGAPQFSMIRYVDNANASTTNGASIGQASGGSVLHFTVLYETEKSKITKAETALKQKLGNNSLRLSGPIIFKEGRYSLVSSVLNRNNNSVERSILAIGKAPVVEGSWVPLSFELTPEQSKILLESFKMTTPDISLVFDMAFEGITDAFQADMTVDWSAIKRGQHYRAGGSAYFIGADVEAQVAEMVRNNSIKLTTTGQDANIESLISKLYDRIVQLLYDPVEPEKMMDEEQMSGVISQLLDPASGLLASRNTTGFGLFAGFKYKDIQSEGKSVMHFNARSVNKKHHLITFNIGNFYKHYGDKTNHFKTISLEDPDFQQREIRVGIDGDLAGEFDKMINSVTVNLQKVHQSGDTTMRELVVRKSDLVNGEALRLIYGSVNDQNRSNWLSYQVKTKWHFSGGYGEYETPWQDHTSAMINLFAPFERRNIQLLGDINALADIKAIVVKVNYSFFGQNRSFQQVIRPGENLTDKSFQLITPVDEFEYNYTIHWIKSDGHQLKKTGKDSFGLLFLDELPEITIQSHNNN